MLCLKMALIFVFVSNVATWTVDLAEIKKIVSENEINSNSANNIDTVDEQNELYDATEYAKNYEYQSYEEKKMSDIILNGSDYLEGLSNALSKYNEILEKCISSNTTVSQDQVRESGAKMFPDDVCETVINNSNSIRKLTQIVFLTTSKMRDKTDKDIKTENEMLVRLAWLLDQLARLTGFEPNKNDFTDLSELSNDSTTESTKNASLEIMEQMENGRVMSSPPEEATELKSIQKRSAENPLEEVANYYLKYKSWANDNPNKDKNNEIDAFDVDNNLKIKSIHKRSLKKKGLNFIVTDNTKRNIEKPKTNSHKKMKSNVHKLQPESLKIKYKLQKIRKGNKM